MEFNRFLDWKRRRFCEELDLGKTVAKSKTSGLAEVC